MYNDATDPGVLIRQKSRSAVELVRDDARYKARVGDTHDVWEILFELFPGADEDDRLRERLLEEVNARRLVVAHRFIGGQPVAFLYSRQLLADELRHLSEPRA